MFIKPSLVKVTFFDQNPSTFSVLTNLSNCYSLCLKLVIHCDNIHQLLRPERCLLKFLVGCPRNFPKVLPTLYQCQYLQNISVSSAAAERCRCGIWWEVEDGVWSWSGCPRGDGPAAGEGKLKLNAPPFLSPVLIHVYSLRFTLTSCCWS